MKQSKVKFVENGGFEAAWMLRERVRARVKNNARSCLKRYFQNTCHQNLSAKDRKAAIGKTIIPEHTRSAIESIVIKKITVQCW